MKLVGLREIRKKKGYSQVKVSLELNVSREAISNYENGKRSPDVDMLVKFSDYFNVSIDYLIRGVEFKKKIITLRYNKKSTYFVDFLLFQYMNKCTVVYLFSLFLSFPLRNLLLLQYTYRIEYSAALISPLRIVRGLLPL
ncbi:MAG: helix-turn-helix transcriptional regulator [Clostridia bacterium]|nr:helix-turn-helix transcriptional regulator [Clostridia bacterium]